MFTMEFYPTSCSRMNLFVSMYAPDGSFVACQANRPNLDLRAEYKRLHAIGRLVERGYSFDDASVISSFGGRLGGLELFYRPELHGGWREDERPSLYISEPEPAEIIDFEEADENFKAMAQAHLEKWGENVLENLCNRFGVSYMDTLHALKQLIQATDEALDNWQGSHHRTGISY